MTGRQCKYGHDMRLTDVHLQTVNGVSAYRARFGVIGGLQVVKVFECPLCDQKDDVVEEIR